MASLGFERTDFEFVEEWSNICIFARPSPSWGYFPGKYPNCPSFEVFSRKFPFQEPSPVPASGHSALNREHAKTKRMKGAKWDPAKMSSRVFCCSSCCYKLQSSAALWKSQHQRPQNSLAPSQTVWNVLSRCIVAPQTVNPERCALASLARSLVTRYLQRLEVEAVSSGNEAAAAALLH